MTAYRAAPASAWVEADLAPFTAVYDRRSGITHLLAEPARFTAADVSDLPWTEIDFPEDVAKAREAILPALED